MFDIRIDGLDRLKKLADMDWKGRAKATMKYISGEIVNRIYQDVKEAIPTGEGWMKAYKDSLRVYEIADLPKGSWFGCAIASRISGDWSSVDGSLMIVYFSQNDRSPAVEVGKILEEMSPFAIDQVPNLDAYGARVIIRRVRPDEVEETRRRNKSDRPRLLRRLEEEGVHAKLGPAKIEGKVLFDLPFMVMRMELGFGGIRAPHWRPALRKISVHLHEMVRSPNLWKRIEEYLKPASIKWEKDLRPERIHRIFVRDLNQFEDFQTQVTSR